MEKYFNILKKCSLFADVEQNDILKLLNCLNSKKKEFQKNECIFSFGDPMEYMGIVLSGSVHIVQEDFWGNRTILSAVSEGEVFGESFVCPQPDVLPVSVFAREDSVILLIDCKSILSQTSDSCVFQTGLISNLLKILAYKNIMLTRKIKHISKKTTREKVLSYLSECAVSAGRDSFEIPFNRQEMADYLSVERSALSSTLAKLKNDGVLLYHKNNFTLFERED